MSFQVVSDAIYYKWCAQEKTCILQPSFAAYPLQMMLRERIVKVFRLSCIFFDISCNDKSQRLGMMDKFSPSGKGHISQTCVRICLLSGSIHVFSRPSIIYRYYRCIMFSIGSNYE